LAEPEKVHILEPEVY